MAVSKDECILTDEGYKTIKEKYSTEINELIKDMINQHEQDKMDEEKRYLEYMRLNEKVSDKDNVLSTDEELPFMEEKNEYL